MNGPAERIRKGRACAVENAKSADSFRGPSRARPGGERGADAEKIREERREERTKRKKHAERENEREEEEEEQVERRREERRRETGTASAQAALTARVTLVALAADYSAAARRRRVSSSGRTQCAASAPKPRVDFTLAGMRTRPRDR